MANKNNHSICPSADCERIKKNPKKQPTEHAEPNLIPTGKRMLLKVTASISIDFKSQDVLSWRKKTDILPKNKGKIKVFEFYTTKTLTKINSIKIIQDSDPFSQNSGDLKGDFSLGTAAELCYLSLVAADQLIF